MSTPASAFKRFERFESSHWHGLGLSLDLSTST